MNRSAIKGGRRPARCVPVVANPGRLAYPAGGGRPVVGLRALLTAPVIGLLLLLVFSPAASLAAPGDLIRRIVSPEVQPGVNFGEVIAAAGNDILVGEPGWWDGTDPFIGRAYLMDGTTGEVKHTLRNPEPDAYDSFGISVAVVGDWLVVGADQDRVVDAIGRGMGTVYGFDRLTGDLSMTISNPNLDARGRFGVSVSNVSGMIAVGSPSDDVGDAANAGAVYLIDSQTGDVVSHLPNPEPDPFEIFSNRYAIADLGEGKIIVGNALNRFGGDYEAHIGSVYVLDQRNGEVLHRMDNPGTIPPLNPTLLDNFGFSVAAVDGNVVVGARSADFGGISNSGAVYVFDGEDGELEFMIGNPNPGRSANFGRSIATVGNNILVGAWGETVHGVEAAGAVYLFDGQTGSLLLHVQNPQPQPFDQFGSSVAAYGNDVLVGARSDSPFGVPAAGSVYLYRGVPEPSTLVMSVLALGFLGFRARRVQRK